MHTLRALGRLLGMFAWVLHGCWLVYVRFPKLNAAEHGLAVEAWAQHMLRIIGVQVHVQGQPAAGPVLVAANHISWLDILVMHAASHCRFVAKSEIRHWPLVGTLTTGGGSLYIERASSRDAMRVVHQMAEALQQGDVLAVFPEGGTGDGITLLPFHANLLQAAIAVNAPVQPVALKFVDAQSQTRSLAPCYRDDDTLLSSVWRTLCAPPLLAEVHYGATEQHLGRSRREWAHDLRERVAHLAQ